MDTKRLKREQEKDEIKTLTSDRQDTNSSFLPRASEEVGLCLMTCQSIALDKY